MQSRADSQIVPALWFVVKVNKTDCTRNHLIGMVAAHIDAGTHGVWQGIDEMEEGNR